MREIRDVRVYRAGCSGRADLDDAYPSGQRCESLCEVEMHGDLIILGSTGGTKVVDPAIFGTVSRAQSENADRLDVQTLGNSHANPAFRFVDRSRNGVDMGFPLALSVVPGAKSAIFPRTDHLGGFWQTSRGAIR